MFNRDAKPKILAAEIVILSVILWLWIFAIEPVIGGKRQRICLPAAALYLYMISHQEMKAISNF